MKTTGVILGLALALACMMGAFATQQKKSISLLEDLMMVGGKGCLTTCSSNNDCTDLHCAKCSEGNQCVKGAACGQSCSVNTDCDQASNCTQCTQQVCTRFCGQPCKYDKECIRFGCDACQDRKCRSWKCNMPCTTDAGCTGLPTDGCARCDYNPNTLSGQCKSGCGHICTADSQCIGQCPFCANRTCSTWP